MKQEAKTGQTDYTVLIFIPDPASTDGSGKTGLVAANLTVSFSRVETDNDVTVTDATGSLNDLASLTAAHNDWGVIEVSNTLAPGLYRLDLADAVFASGAWSAVVYVMITTSAAAASPMEFALVPQAPIDGVLLAPVTHTGAVIPTVSAVTGLTASDVGAIKTKTDFLPSATAGAAGGVFIAGSNAATTVATFTSTGAVVFGSTFTVTTNLLVSGTTTLTGAVTASNASNNIVGIDVAKISGDATAADNAELFFDNTGFNASNSIIGVASSVTALGAGSITNATFTTDAIDSNALATSAADEIGGAVWDITLASHVTAGSTGEALNAAGAAGDPWITALPGAYGAGTAGKIVGDNLNATITSRMASYTQPTGFLAATFPAGTIANTTNITAGTITTTTNLTNLPAITAGWLTATGIAADAFTAAKFAADVGTEFADALLNRDMAAVTVTNTRSPINAFRALRNRWSNAGGTYSVYAEDDTTVAWSGPVDTDAAAIPVIGVDPT
jgi:hypothetical protein